MRVELEGLIKILFGNYGTKAKLLQNLRAFASEAEHTLEFWREIAEDLDRGRQSFPERLHLKLTLLSLGVGARRAQRKVGGVGDRASREVAGHDSALQIPKRRSRCFGRSSSACVSA